MNQATSNPSQPDPVVRQSLELLQRLLTPARTRVELVSGRPILSASQAGALAVVGMRTNSPKTWVSVFIYSSWTDATAGLRVVKAGVGSTAGKAIIAALSGSMVLYGWGAGEGVTAPYTRYVLENILTAFEEE